VHFICTYIFPPILLIKIKCPMHQPVAVECIVVVVAFAAGSAAAVAASVV
jgi:hypothetical protein